MKKAWKVRHRSSLGKSSAAAVSQGSNMRSDSIRALSNYGVLSDGLAQMSPCHYGLLRCPHLQSFKKHRPPSIRHILPTIDLKSACCVVGITRISIMAFRKLAVCRTNDGTRHCNTPQLVVETARSTMFIRTEFLSNSAAHACSENSNTRGSSHVEFHLFWRDLATSAARAQTPTAPHHPLLLPHHSSPHSV